MSVQDVCGFLLTATTATIPLLVVTWLGGMLSKSGSVDLQTYLFVAISGVAASIPFGFVARAVGRGTQEAAFCHVLAGVMAGLLLLVGFATLRG